MIKLSFSTLMRIATLMAACVLVGCGGASSTVNPLTPTRIIAFGDAFSTVDDDGFATYSVNTSSTDATVASRIATIYGLTLKYRTSTSAVISSGTAYSYAAGTATASDTYTQIKDYYLAAGNVPGSNDLFIITAGTQDIATAALTNDTTAIATAATKLTAAVQLLTNAGAKYVLVMQPINVARTPPFLSASGVRPVGAKWTALINGYAQALSYDSGTACQSFSCLLSTKLNTAFPATSSHQPVLLVDLMSYFNLITGTTNTGSANTFGTYGVTNPDLVVCNTASWTNYPTTTPSCTTSTLATTSTNQYTSTAWTYATSVFAYDYYTTPYVNQLMGSYIYNYNFYRAGWR
jgi:hypothetical protein